MQNARGVFVCTMGHSFEHDAQSLRVWKTGGGFSDVVRRARDMLEAVPPRKDETSKSSELRVNAGAGAKHVGVRAVERTRPAGAGRWRYARLTAVFRRNIPDFGPQMALHARNSRGAFVRATVQSYEHGAPFLRASEACGEVAYVVQRARAMPEAGPAAKGRNIKVVEIARECRGMWETFGGTHRRKDAPRRGDVVEVRAVLLASAPK